MVKPEAAGDMSVRVVAADPDVDARAGKSLPVYVLALRFFTEQWRIRLRPAPEAGGGGGGGRGGGCRRRHRQRAWRRWA